MYLLPKLVGPVTANPVCTTLRFAPRRTCSTSLRHSEARFYAWYWVLLTLSSPHPDSALPRLSLNSWSHICGITQDLLQTLVSTLIDPRHTSRIPLLASLSPLHGPPRDAECVQRRSGSHIPHGRRHDAVPQVLTVSAPYPTTQFCFSLLRLTRCGPHDAECPVPVHFSDLIPLSPHPVDPARCCSTFSLLRLCTPWTPHDAERVQYHSRSHILTSAP